MNSFFKVGIVILYLSTGIFFGMAVRYLPNPSVLRKWGLISLTVASIICPLGISVFGWLRGASNLSVILVCVISIAGTAFWFVLSAVAVALIGAGNG